MLMTKEFLQTKVKYFLHDHIADQFGTTVKIPIYTTRSNITNPAYIPITAMVTKLSEEDNERFSVDQLDTRTVDIFIEDLTALQVTYPNKFVKNNFNKTEIQINGKEYKVLMQKQTEGFEAMIRLICVEEIQ